MFPLKYSFVNKKDYLSWVVKTCNRCKVEKSVSMFSKRNLKTGTLSYNYWCKACQSEVAKKKNIEKVSNIVVESLEGEIWKPVVGYEGYFISNFIRLKSSPKSNRLYETLIYPRVQKTTGYYSTSLYPGLHRRFKRVTLHRMVAIAFIPNPGNKPCVNHINHIRTDNRIENLEWCTHQENLNHASKMGRMQRGEKRHNNALSEIQVLEIFNSTTPQRQIAKTYNVNQGTVAKIRTGQNWSYLTGKIYDH